MYFFSLQNICLGISNFSIRLPNSSSKPCQRAHVVVSARTALASCVCQNLTCLSVGWAYVSPSLLYSPRQEKLLGNSCGLVLWHCLHSTMHYIQFCAFLRTIVKNWSLILGYIYIYIFYVLLCLYELTDKKLKKRKIIWQQNTSNSSCYMYCLLFAFKVF